MSNESLKYFCSYAQYFFAALTALAAMGNIYYGRLIDQQKARESATSGSLSHKSAEKVPPLHPTHSRESVYIRFGSITMGFPARDLQEGVNISKVVSFNGGGIAPVTVKVVDDKLLISAEIFGLDGKLVGEIIDNEWSVNPNNYYKRNYDDNAVEIIDQHNKVVLSAEITNKNQIVVSGIFVNPGRSVSFFSNDDPMIFSIAPEAIKVIEKKYNKPWSQIYEDEAKKIKRIFKYGKGSQGQRVTNKN